MDSSLIKSVKGDVDSNLARDTGDRNERGEPVPAERFPKVLYGMYASEKIRKLPDICYAGTWVVSTAFADVLRRFELGLTSLYPTKVFEGDRKTPLAGAYFCINFGAKKATFLPGQSRATKPWHDQDLWRLNPAPRDEDFVLTIDALKGPDLWIEEQVVRAFFLSGRLVRALRAAGLTRRLGLRRRRVIASEGG
jgi:hypothetical protein